MWRILSQWWEEEQSKLNQRMLFCIRCGCANDESKENLEYNNDTEDYSINILSKANDSESNMRWHHDDDDDDGDEDDEKDDWRRSEVTNHDQWWVGRMRSRVELLPVLGHRIHANVRGELGMYTSK